MNALLETFIERKDELLSATLTHIGISLTALLIAIVITVPLAIWLVNHRKVGEVVLQITSVLQTIPSLALLGLLIPFVGIGSTPALIALVIYALLPIFQNTYVGLSEIDPALEEAATAFGMSSLRRLFKVDLPIAMPIIISGIRSALVLIIGTATLAALVGGGGLGNFILLGIDRNNLALTLIGAIASALLAVIFSGLIRMLQYMKPKWSLGIILTLCLMIVGGTIYEQYQNREETVRIAGKLGSEPDILINMYKELIEEADPNMTVELKSNFGKTSFVFNALKSDEVDIYPEFTGTVLDSLVSVPESLDASQLSPEETYQEADKRLKEQFDMTLLKPMAYQNTYALAVRDDYAKDHQLTTISDLKAISQQVQAGFTLEFIDRDDGYKGIQSLYDLQFGDVASMEPSLRYEAIGNGDIDITDAYSTDSQLEEYHLKLLEDDQQLFASYQGAPLMRQEFYDDHPKIVEALNQLAGQITEEEMAKMNYAVNVEEKDAQEVAHDYLVAHGLVEEGD